MINKNNGQRLNSIQASIEQSLADIATTPIGSRIMRREYGSLVAELLDQPINDSLVLKCYSALYTAASTWENRVSINHIRLVSVQGSGLVFDIECIYQLTGQEMNLRIPLNMGASK